MMKSLFTAVIFSALIAGPVTAADMAVKAPPQPDPGFSWSGCYLGGNVGGAWGREKASTSGSPAAVGNQAPALATLNGSSGIGGVQAGCNVQFAPASVAGVEADWGAARIGGSAAFPNLFADTGQPVGSGGLTFSRTTDWLASLRGRLGMTPTPNTLLYITGGAAWARSNFNGFDAGFGGCPVCRTTAFSADQHGWVAGGGVEWAPWRNNWLLRAEYLYYRLSGATSAVFFPGPTPIAFFWNGLSVSEARLGLSYKFSAAPKP